MPNTADVAVIGQELPITGSPGGLEELANNIPDASRVLFAVTLRAPL